MRRRLWTRALVIALVASTSAPFAPVAAAAAGTDAADPIGTRNVVPSIREEPVVDVWQPPSAGGFVPDNGGVRIEPDPVVSPFVPTEEADLRSEFGTVVANGDGTYTAELAASRLNFVDDQGNWQQIDLTLVATADGAFVTRANDRTVRLDPKATDGSLATLAGLGDTLGLRVPGMGDAGSVDVLSGKLSLTTDPASGHLEIAPTPEGLEFSFRLDRADQTHTYEVILDAGGLVPSVSFDGQTVLFKDDKGLVHAKVTAPWVFDAKDAEPGPRAVSVDAILPDGTKIVPAPLPDGWTTPGSPPPPSGGVEPTPSSAPVAPSTAPEPSPEPSAEPSSAPALEPSPSATEGPQPEPSASAPIPSPTSSPVEPPPSADPGTVAAGLAPGEVMLRYTIDEQWITAPDRAFPVVLDPSLQLQNAGANGDSCASANTTYVDNWISSGLPNNYTCWSAMRIGQDNDSGDGAAFGSMRGLIWFDGLQLGTGDGEQVVDAQLYLAKYSGGAEDFKTTMVTGTYGWTNPARWSDQFGEGGNDHIRYLCANGTSNNCSASGAFYGPTAQSPSSSTWFNLDVTSLVRRWYTKNAQDWRPNIGFMVRQVLEGHPENKFRNGGYSTASSRPKLIITYVVPQTKLEFDTASLGPDFAPSTMVADSTSTIRLRIKNNGSAMSFNSTGTDYYRVGYRWLTTKGKLLTATGLTNPGFISLPGTVTSPNWSGWMDLPVDVPPNPGSYTLKLDLVHTVNGANLFASDWAKPTKLLSRDKNPNTTPSNVRWTGSSVVERADFSVAVVSGSGTNVGETKSIATPEGGSAGINLWSGSLGYSTTTGAGFADLDGGLRVDATYNSGDRQRCGGILAMCGWSTNWDERFDPGANGADYVFQDGTGNRYFVGDGAQLRSSAPYRLERPRQTIFDENTLLWSVSTPTVANLNYGSTGHSLYIPSTGIAESTDFVKFDLNAYPLVSYATYSTLSGKTAIGFRIIDNETGDTSWFFYANGGTSTWSVGSFPTVWTGNHSITGTWYQYLQLNLFADARTQTPTLSRDLTVDAIDLRSDSGGGFAYFDVVRFEGRNSNSFADGLPSATCGGGACTSAQFTTSTDHVEGTQSLKAFRASSWANSPKVTGLTFVADPYPFVSWDWKKAGGNTVVIGFQLKDLRDPTKTGWIYYYAGSEPTSIGTSATRLKVADTVPGEWVHVTRNLADDARQVLGFYNDAPKSTPTTPGPGPIPDDVQLTDYQMIPFDGSYALFDWLHYGSVPNANSGALYGAVTGDDFLVTLPGGELHRFNRVGLLTSIDDVDANATKVVWTYDFATRAYTLDRIRSASDGWALGGGGSADRELVVTRPTGTTVRFQESLSSGRYAEFERDANNDLLSIVPARRSATCAATGPSGCITLAYSGATHLLTAIRDPRRDPAGSTANYSLAVAYDGTNRATTITSDATASAVLRVVNFAASGAAPYQRVSWQDSNGIAGSGGGQFVRFTDFSPNGSVKTEWAPISCGANCGTATASNKLTDSETDGLGNYSKLVSYRSPGATDPVTTRRGTYASSAVDNYADPITGSLTAWDQSATQYQASAAAGNIDAYRTLHAYDGLGRSVSDARPNQKASPAYRGLVTAAGANLKAYWRLGETSGSSAADVVAPPHNGTISATGVTLNQADALVDDADPAMAFNGSTGRITSTVPLPQSAYTIEAWVKPNAAQISNAIAGRFLAGGAMIWVDGNGNYGLAHNAGGSYVTSQVQPVPGRWDHVVGTWDSVTDVATLYVNGRPVASTFASAAPGTGAAAFEIGSNSNGTAGTFFDGSIDEVALYDRALSPAEIAGHYREGTAQFLQTTVTRYDAEGHPVEVSDNAFITNGALELDPTATDNGWDTAGSSVAAESTTTHGGSGSAKVTGSGILSQIAQLAPGQTVRFQAWTYALSGNANWTLYYWDTVSASWTSPPGWTSTHGQAGWLSASYEVDLPTRGTDGRLKIEFKLSTGTGTMFVDDVALFTTFAKATVSTSGLPETRIDELGRVSRLTYVATAAHPAIFATSSIANEVSGGSAPDQNVTTNTSYDAWGRVLTVTDPDDVTTTTTYNVANRTDIASVANEVDPATTYPSYDEIGQRLLVVSPLGETTTTGYDYFGNVAKTTLPAAPAAVVNKATFDGVGRKLSDIANWIDGTPSGIDDLTTSYTLDEYGRVTTTLADDGSGSGFVKAKSTATFDQLGNPLVTMVFADTAASDDRTVTTFYDGSGTAIATQGPIAPVSGAPACPGTGTGLCNETRRIDFNGQVIETTDAYGIKTQTKYDLAGRAVLVVKNPTATTAPDENVATESRFDTMGRITEVKDPLGRTTSTTYDGLDRITRLTRPDTSWTDTVYTVAGRVDRTSSPTWTGDTGVAWTRNLYDAAGRQTTTLANWDSSVNATYRLETFEAGGTSGWTTSGAPFITSSGAALTNDGCTSGSACLHATGARSGMVALAGTGQGAKLVLTGTFVPNHTYKARFYAKLDSGTASVEALLGAAETLPRFAKTSTPVALTSAYQPIDVSWDNTATETAVVVALRSTTAGSSTIRIDDLQVWDAGVGGTAPSQASIPTTTLYDADGRIAASIIAPTLAGGPPLVTRTAYDALGRTTKVTVNEIVGAGTSDSVSNLATSTAFDDLGRVLSQTNPSGIATRFGYDRLGRLTDTTAAFIDGNHSGTGLTEDDIKTTYGRNALGELTALCSAIQVIAGCTTSGSDTKSWRYTYDDAGHLITQVAPDNVSATDLATRRWTYDAGGQLTRVCDHAPVDADCSVNTAGATRFTTSAYDDVGRLTNETLYVGPTGSGTSTLSWVHTYDAAGQRKQTDYDDVPGGAPTETWTFDYDTAGRADWIKRGAAVQTDFAWNPDDTLQARVDPTGTSTFTYDWADRQISATSTIYSGNLGWTWGLDGLLAGRAWPVGSSAAMLSYDGAKRPTKFTEKAGTTLVAEFTKGYDRNGSTTLEGRSVPGAGSTIAGTYDQSFVYDKFGRLYSAALNSQTTTYAYDQDGNRTGVDAPGTANDLAFAYDRTDVPRQKLAGGPPLDFTVDAYGNLTGAAEGTSTTLTSYHYDRADHLTQIDPPGTDPTADLTVDAFGRIATRTVAGSTTETMSYLGTTEAVVRIAGSATTDAAISAKGDRTAVKVGTETRYSLPDLHGNTAASLKATDGSLGEALRYDGFGKLVDAYPGSGSASAFARWKFQANLDVSPTADALYENGFRFYSPGLGTFTGADTLIGQAENPLSTNRYLYAGASPWTLIDPTGHCATWIDGVCNDVRNGSTGNVTSSTKGTWGEGPTVWKPQKQLPLLPSVVAPAVYAGWHDSWSTDTTMAAADQLAAMENADIRSRRDAGFDWGGAALTALAVAGAGAIALTGVGLVAEGGIAAGFALGGGATLGEAAFTACITACGGLALLGTDVVAGFGGAGRSGSGSLKAVTGQADASLEQLGVVGNLGEQHGLPSRTFGSGLGPHEATVTVTGEGGVVSGPTVFRSGGMTPEEAALGFPQSSLATHTERRAIAGTDLQRGQTMTIAGSYPPCPSCKGAMNAVVRSSGGEIVYTWDGYTWRAGG
ncbi:MAG TPA: LamG-like jellyroll fold domain-containing protein [Candidatus Limnocylindrales bacterium]|nr:LamG-like jellyroll fold domain-containing protein [Candidatus Limnocylindrales bacterium]